MPPRLLTLAALSISAIAMPADAATLMPGILHAPAPAPSAIRPAVPARAMAIDTDSVQPQNASPASQGEANAPDRPSHLPEPASWALILAGFGLLGSTMRRQGRARSRIQFG